MGGDQQLGAMIANGELDVLIFFSDQIIKLSHNIVVKALIRFSTLNNIVLARNRTTADFVVHGDHFDRA